VITRFIGSGDHRGFVDYKNSIPVHIFLKYKRDVAIPSHPLEIDPFMDSPGLLARVTGEYLCGTARWGEKHRFFPDQREDPDEGADKAGFAGTCIPFQNEDRPEVSIVQKIVKSPCQDPLSLGRLEWKGV